ncbi:MAG: globin domain-containing protein [Rhodobacteraceae bacterium]|nr:globin domain-containing protein [Paracoccaceae bacterium]
MTESDIVLVENSFSTILPQRVRVARMFYDDLFQTAPHVRPYFGAANMSEQGVKLMDTLAFVVGALRDADRMLPVARELAVRHVGYGVRAADYDCVGASLIRTLAAGLGNTFTPDTRAAWIATYGLISEVMTEAAYGPGKVAQ